MALITNPAGRAVFHDRKVLSSFSAKQVCSEEYLEGGNVSAVLLSYFAVKNSYWKLHKKLLSACCGKMYNKPIDKGRVLLYHSYGVMLFCRPKF